jgi:WD40 repeat protein/serine/threonine protein kinase
MNLHTLIDGKYFVQALLNKGEIASTYQLWHNGWEITLQAKVIEQASKDEPLYARCRHDGQAWVDLGVHPNLVCAYFLREIEGRLWLFVEAVQGKSLALLQKVQQKKLPEIMAIALEIANGIAYLHSEGVAYGNLNQQNVIVATDGRVRLANIRWDWWEGLVTLSKGMRSTLYPNADGDRHVALKKNTLYRLSYQPPEYFVKEATPDMASDTYQFGVLLYELLSGTPPLYYAKEELENLFAVYSRGHQAGDMVPLAKKCPELPAALLSLNEECLGKSPAARPRFANILATLQEIYTSVNGQPYLFERWDDNTLMAMALNNRALGHIDNQELDKAQTILQEVQQLAAHRATAMLNLNLLKLRTGQASLAQFYDRVHSYAVVDQQQTLWLLGRACLEYGSFISQVFDELQKSSTLDEMLKILQAHFYYRLHEYQATRDVLRTIVHERQRHQDFWYRLGAASLALKMNSEAQQAWEFGLRQELPLWDLVVAYSMFMASQGSWAKARSLLDNAMQHITSYLQTPAPLYTWSQVYRLTVSAQYGVMEVAFSQDHQYLFAWTLDGKSRAWEWPSGKERKDLIPPSPSSTTRTSKNLARAEIRDAAISADGSIGVTIHGDKLLRVWQLQKSECVAELAGHQDVVTAVALTPNGKIAVSASMDRTLKVWNLTRRECITTLHGHQDYINCVAVSEDGCLAVSGGWDKTARVWDLLNERCLMVVDGHGGDVTAVAFSSDGKTMIVGDAAPNVQVWDIPARKRLAMLEGHTGRITAVHISVDGHFALSGTSDGIVYVYEDIAQRPCPCWVQASYMLEILPPPMPLDQRVRIAEEKRKIRDFLSQKQVIPALQSYHVVRKWHADFGEEEEMLKELFQAARQSNLICNKVNSYELTSALIHESNVVGFVLTGPHFVFSLTEDGTLRRWNYYNGRNDIFWQRPSLSAISLDYVVNGKERFCISGKDKMVYFWRPEVDEWVSLEGHAAEIRAVKMTPQTNYTIAGSSDGCVQLWDLTKENLVNDWRAHSTMITDIALNAEGTMAVTGSTDGNLRGWELPSGRQLMQNQQKCSPILCLCMPLKKNNIVISGSLDGSIREWSLTSGLYYNIIKAYDCAVTCLYQHPDGQLLVSGGQNGDIKIWDMDSRKCLSTINAHQGAVNKVAMSSDATWLFSAGQDRIIRVWMMEWEWTPFNARKTGRIKKVE